MPDTRPELRQRALLVSRNATCRWNKLLIAELSVAIPPAAVSVATEPRAEVRNLQTRYVFFPYQPAREK